MENGNAPHLNCKCWILFIFFLHFIIMVELSLIGMDYWITNDFPWSVSRRMKWKKTTKNYELYFLHKCIQIFNLYFFTWLTTLLNRTPLHYFENFFPSSNINTIYLRFCCSKNCSFWFERINILICFYQSSVLPVLCKCYWCAICAFYFITNGNSTYHVASKYLRSNTMS